MEILAGDRHVFVDTNILVFANVATLPFHEKAKTKLMELVESGCELYISNQVIREYLAVLSRPDVNGKRSADKALITDVKRLRSEYIVLFESNRTLNHLQMLLTNCLTGGKQIHDANIVATMIENDLKILLTHNVTDFIRFSKFVTTITF